jgi:hypothetical protein
VIAMTTAAIIQPTAIQTPPKAIHRMLSNSEVKDIDLSKSGCVHKSFRLLQANAKRHGIIGRISFEAPQLSHPTRPRVPPHWYYSLTMTASGQRILA